MQLWTSLFQNNFEGGGGKTLGSSKAIKLAEYFVSNNPLLKALIAAVWLRTFQKTPLLTWHQYWPEYRTKNFTIWYKKRISYDPYIQHFFCLWETYWKVLFLCLFTADPHFRSILV